MFPGKRNSLDALCDRFGISNAHRTLHGALLDSELLAEVYLAMTRGQDSFSIELEAPVLQSATNRVSETVPTAEVLLLKATAEELVEHDNMLDRLDKEAKGKCVWRASSN